jgi:hypothetical protein
MAEWIEQLERLTALHRSGALTDAEFAEQKALLLAGRDLPEAAPAADYTPTDAAQRSAVPWLPIGIGAALLVAIAGGFYAFRPGASVDPAAAASAAVNAEPTGPLKTYYAAAKANVRNLPSGQGSQVVGELARGQSVTGRDMIGSDGTSKWLKRDGVAEYVWMVNLVETQPPAIEAVVGARKTSGSDITLYTSPSTTSPARQVVKAGAELEVLSKLAGGWGEGRLQGGGVGYFQVPADMFAAPGALLADGGTMGGVATIDGAASPEGVIMAYGGAIKHGDTGGVMAVIDPRVRQSLGPKMMMAMGQMQRNAEQKGGIERVWAEDLSQNGDFASGRMLTKFNNGQSTFENVKMVRINGRWYAQVGG